MHTTPISRLSKATLLTALLFCAMLGAYMAFGHQLIGALYAGELAPALRGVFGGAHPLEFYLQKKPTGLWPRGAW